MKKLVTVGVLALSCASNGCKHVDETKIADKAACATMIRSIADNSRLLAAVTARISDADRALQMADRWNQKQVTDAEDGSGLFSGAAKRAPMHAGAARALCEAADQAHAGIEHVAHEIHEPAVHADEHTLNLTCFDEFMVIAPDKPSREKVAAQWQTQLVEVQVAESRYRDACKASFGTNDSSSNAGPLGGTREPDIK